MGHFNKNGTNHDKITIIRCKINQKAVIKCKKLVRSGKCSTSYPEYTFPLAQTNYLCALF
jgi:hypothetical protein